MVHHIRGSFSVMHCSTCSCVITAMTIITILYICWSSGCLTSLALSLYKAQDMLQHFRSHLYEDGWLCHPAVFTSSSPSLCCQPCWNICGFTCALLWHGITVTRIFSVNQIMCGIGELKMLCYCRVSWRYRNSGSIFSQRYIQWRSWRRLQRPSVV